MKELSFKQRLFHSHNFFGIISALFLYISIFFGIFAIYLPYISVWEKPSRHFNVAVLEEIQFEKMLNPMLKEKNVSNSKIEIILPNFKGDPALAISRPFEKANFFNPINHSKIEDEANSQLANFLNEMHYGRPLGIAGLMFFGLISVLVLFICLNGLMMVFMYKFKNKISNAQSFFAVFHRKIFIWLIAPFFLIVLIGAVFGTSFFTQELISQLTTKQSSNLIIGKMIFKETKLPKKQGDEKMLDISHLINKAKSINPNINFEKITLYNWQDKSALIKFEGYNPKMPFLNGFTNKPNIILKGTNAELVSQSKVLDREWVILLIDFVAFIHLLFGVDIISRTIIAVLMTICGLGVIFSILLYIKRKTKMLESFHYYHWFSRFALAVILGVIPAVASLFLTQWLLPFELNYRLTWQQGIFFDIWLISLAYSFYELNSLKIIRAFLGFGGVLFILSVLFHWLKMGLSVELVRVFSVDMALLLMGALCIFANFKLKRKDLNV